jgi:diguanylate cyclase (GGDEF)-like protein
MSANRENLSGDISIPRHFSDTTEHLPCAVFSLLMDEALTVKHANEYFCEMFRCGRDELPISFLSLAADDGDRERLNDAVGYAKAYNQAQRLRLKLPLHTQEAETVNYSLCFNCYTGSGGEHMLSCIALIDDYGSEEVSENSWRDMESIAGSMPGCISKIIYHNRQITYLYLSGGLHRIAGYLPEDPEFGSIESIIFQEDLPEYYRNIEEQIAGGNISLSYRITEKNGRQRWVLQSASVLDVKDGVYTLICVYIDLTGSQNELMYSKRETHRLNIMLQANNDTLFEYDLKNDRMHFFDKALSEFGEESNWAVDKFLQNYIRSNLIHPDYQSMMRRVLIQGAPTTCELLLKTPYSVSEYRWFSMMCSYMRDKSGNIVETFGLLRDIHALKTAQMVKEDAAKRDSLTGLYRKEEGEKIIRERLEHRAENNTIAIAFVDISEFSGIIKQMGEEFGSVIIKTVAADMLSLVPKTSVCVRVGMDQFVVYVTNAADERMMQRLASEQIRRFNDSLKPLSNICKVDLAVGFAFSPRDGSDLDELIAKSYTAMKLSADTNGKSVVYNGEQLLEPAIKRIHLHTRDELSSFALAGDVMNILVTGKKVGESLSAALGMIAVHFGVDRAVIFNEDPYSSHKVLRMSFEWCGKGVKSAAHIIRFDKGSDYRRAFSHGFETICDSATLKDHPENNPYFFHYCEDMHSSAMFALRSGKAITGFISYERRNKNKSWYPNEVVQLGYLSEILAAYVDKLAVLSISPDGGSISAQTAKEAEIFYYSINTATYEVVSLHKGIPGYKENMQIGTKCHEGMFGRSFPCENCPAKYSPNVQNGFYQIYSDELNAFILVRFNKLRVSGNEYAHFYCFENKYANVEMTADGLKELNNEDLKAKMGEYDVNESAITAKDTLGNALMRGEFSVYVKPRVDLNSGRVTGSKAYACWMTNDGMILPEDYTAIFRKMGFIKDLELFTLSRALMFNKLGVTLSVDMSDIQLEDAEFFTKIRNIMNGYDIPYSLVELSFSAKVLNNPAYAEQLVKLREKGFSIALRDIMETDFATLRGAAADVFALPCRWAACRPSPAERMLIEAVSELAEGMGARCACEELSAFENDAEKKYTAELLKSMGCELALWGEAVPDKDFEQQYIGKKMAIN